MKADLEVCVVGVCDLTRVKMTVWGLSLCTGARHPAWRIVGCVCVCGRGGGTSLLRPSLGFTATDLNKEQRQVFSELRSTQQPYASVRFWLI